MASSVLNAKVVSLRDAREHMSAREVKVVRQSAEQRTELRHARQDRLFAQVTACEQTDLIGTTFSCHTQDVSSGGICVSSEVAIPVGAKLDLWIENSSRPGKYFLTSDVRWVAALGSDGCTLGLALQASPTTDIEQWRQDH